jgi:hypothetical protein
VSRPRFLFDENVEAFLVSAVWRIRPGLAIRRLGDPGVPPLGSPDRAILEFCSRQGYLLFTRDRSTIPAEVAAVLESGLHLPGVFILAPRSTASELVADLVLLDDLYVEVDWEDTLTYLPL